MPLTLHHLATGTDFINFKMIRKFILQQKMISLKIALDKK